MRYLKQKTIFALTSLVVLFFLITTTGCGGDFFRGRTDTMETYDFQKGKEGIQMEFLEGMPPKQIFVGSDFSTAVRIKNMGSYDIDGDAQLKIIVPDRSAFNFKEGQEKEFYLRGKSLYLEEGEQDIIMFPMKALCFPGYDGTRMSIVTNYTRKLNARVCYYYETNANVDLCIDTLKYLRQPHDQPVCEMKDIRRSGGQGGPVGVTGVSAQIIPQSETETQLQLSISLKKLAGRDSAIYGPDGGCDVDNQNEVQISVELGGEPMDCTPVTVKLKERDAVSTICKKNVDPALGAFTSPLSVNMKYYIQENEFKDITVEPPPGDLVVSCSELRGGD